MLPSCLYFPEFGLDESQNDILGLSPRYTSPTSSSDAQRIYPELTEAVVCCPGRLKKRGSAYTHESLRGEE